MLTSAPLIQAQCYDFHQLAQPLVTDEIDALFGDNKSLNPEILGALPFDEIHFYVQHSIPVQLQPPILLRLFLLKAIPWIKKGFWPKCFMISFFPICANCNQTPANITATYCFFQEPNQLHLQFFVVTGLSNFHVLGVNCDCLTTF